MAITRCKRDKRMAEMLAKRLHLVIRNRTIAPEDLQHWTRTILSLVCECHNETELFGAVSWVCNEYHSRFKSIRTIEAFDGAFLEILRQYREMLKYTVPETVIPMADMVLRDFPNIDKRDGRAVFYTASKWALDLWGYAASHGGWAYRWTSLLYFIEELTGHAICSQPSYRFAAVYIAWVSKITDTFNDWDGKLRGFWPGDPRFTDFINIMQYRYDGRRLSDADRIFLQCFQHEKKVQ